MKPRFGTIADLALVKSICTHPQVRCWTSHDGAPEFNAIPWLDGHGLTVLVDGGCFLLAPLGERLCAVHTNFLPEARGKAALRAAAGALAFVFTQSDIETLVTAVPENNPAADWFTRIMRFRATYSQPARWLHGEKRWALNHYCLTIDDWILQGHLREKGKEFHAMLPETHEEDPIHDAYVGAVITLSKQRRVAKALRIYNRWAGASGYVPLTLVSLKPLRIDARDFFVSIENGEIKIEYKEDKSCLLH